MYKKSVIVMSCEIPLTHRLQQSDVLDVLRAREGDVVACKEHTARVDNHSINSCVPLYAMTGASMCRKNGQHIPGVFVIKRL